MLYYLLQTVFFQILFLVLYDVFHKKDTFFSLNRLYLLSTSVLSFILPFIKIKSIRENIPEEYIFQLPTVFIGQQTEVETLSALYISDPTGNINWWQLCYGIGVFFMLILFIRKIIKLRLLKKCSGFNRIENYTVYTLVSSKDAFSFWNTIYLGDQISDVEKEQIITHEIIHLKEKHSLDLLWFEFLKIIFWFNPLVYVYQSKTNTLHEFIADAKSIKILGKRKYYEQLLTTVFDTENIKFINQFYDHSLLKKRIMMLQKSQSQSIAKYKYLATIPVLALMLIFTSFSEKEQITTSIIKETKQLQVKKQIPFDSIKKGIPFTEIDKIPTTKTCKEITDKSQMRKCVSDEIKKFVNTNFNIKAIQPYAKPGINRIYVRFKIDNTGTITDVNARGPAAALEIEAKRVVSSIPPMIPGEYEGKKVAVLYSLPIIIQIKEDKSEKTKKPIPNNKENKVLEETLLDDKKYIAKPGYYMITNIFKHKKYLDKRLQELKTRGFNPKFFKNPKDGYFYMYLEKYDTQEEAKKMLDSNMNGKYNEDLYIQRINGK
ncbi:BlaR1 peptidase M56 [Aquimarina sp. MAR_2010_214]|uniref:M56 family metallopeptidase n=1 Tax=Aquimarina sp. MAR_2010_214 TaxID=1250026 RepID=UPI000C6FF8AB|nr:M56 family metallopeptidase [Aquimarina sp. MAR_2010_214]PKV48200.1 BlaR1 peptidase M56 [Aquimarina sp. MAR_2010_214]